MTCTIRHRLADGEYVEVTLDVDIDGYSVSVADELVSKAGAGLIDTWRRLIELHEGASDDAE